LDRASPFHEDSERGLLGSILLEHILVMGLCHTEGLTQDAFYVPAHQMIYRVCDWLISNGKPVDSIIVAEQLEKYKQLDMVGGRKFLDGLIDSTPTAYHAEHYLEIVKSKWLLRKIADANRQSLDAVMEGGDPSKIISSHIQRILDLADNRSGNLTKVQVAADVMKACDNAQSGIMPGLPSPWGYFNKGTGGAPFGVVSLIAGRSKTRKSYIAHQWGVHAGIESLHPIPGVYYPLEDGQHVAMSRAGCMLANVDSWKFLIGNVTNEEKEQVRNGMKRVVDSSYDIREGRGLGMSGLRLDVAKGVARHGWRYVILDAFKDLDGSGGEGRSEEMTSKSLTDMAREHNLAVIVVHHVRKNRGEDRSDSDKENQYISQEDIRGRARIGDDARMICVLQCKRGRCSDPDVVSWMRRNDYEVRSDDDSIVYYDYLLDCIANNNGRTAAIPLDLNSGTGRFGENPERKVWKM